MLQQEYGNCQVDFLTIGKKAHDILAKQFTIVSDHSKVFDDLTFEEVATLAEDLMQRFAEGQYDRIVLVYNKFKNAATQIVMTEQFLPIAPIEEADNHQSDYIFEPSELEIVEQLIPNDLRQRSCDKAEIIRQICPVEVGTARGATAH